MVLVNLILVQPARQLSAAAAVPAISVDGTIAEEETPVTIDPTSVGVDRAADDVGGENLDGVTDKPGVGAWIEPCLRAKRGDDAVDDAIAFELLPAHLEGA